MHNNLQRIRSETISKKLINLFIYAYDIIYLHENHKMKNKTTLLKTDL